MLEPSNPTSDSATSFGDGALGQERLVLALSRRPQWLSERVIPSPIGEAGRAKGDVSSYNRCLCLGLRAQSMTESPLLFLSICGDPLGRIRHQLVSLREDSLLGPRS